jgi:hypothetical protein
MLTWVRSLRDRITNWHEGWVMLTWVRSLRDRITNWHEGWVMLTWVSRQGAGREQAGSLFIANDSQQQ